MTKIPVIDFAPFRSGSDAAAARRAALEVGRAIRDNGFFYLRNSGISQARVDSMLATSGDLFGMEPDVKKQRQWDGKMPVMGYVPREREALDESRPADLKECFNVPPPDEGLDAATLERIWPESEEIVRTEAESFAASCYALGEQVFRAVATSLELPEDYFAGSHSPGDQMLRLLHYFPDEQASKERQMGAGDHQDHGTLTLLFQDSAGGLEYFSPEGEWEGLPPVKDTVLVNAGDMLMRWTNGAVRSAPHRVLTTANHRYSIAYFFIPKMEVVLSVPATGEVAGTTDDPRPFTAEEFLLLRSLRRTERFYSKRGVDTTAKDLPKGLQDFRNLVASRLEVDASSLADRLQQFGHVEQIHLEARGR
ncbi:MAG: 2OG-Fe(II) oxygenase family protein [Acidobacteriota bacterium]